MKALLVFIGATIFSFGTFAATTYGCRNKNSRNYSVIFEVDNEKISRFQTALGQSGVNPLPVSTLGNGIFEYEFLVEDAYDTKIWLVVAIRSGAVLSANEWLSGNDSDNYEGTPTHTPVICVVQKERGVRDSK